MSIYQRAALAAMFLLPTLAAAEPPAAGPDQPLYHGKTLEFWTRQLNDDDALAREEAIAVLADAGPAAESALPALKELLRDHTATVRLRAAVAIWKVGGKDAGVTPALAEALKGSNRAGRLTALQTLAQIGPGAKDALPQLQAALSDPDAAVRQAAGDVLEQMGAAAVPALAEGLKDRDPAARRGAAAALERLGPDAKEAASSLQDLLKDDDKRVRVAAARALARAAPGDADATAVLIDGVKDADAEARRQAGEALLRIRPRPKAARAAYAILLKEGADLSTRLSAAEALCEVHPDADTALPVLREALRSTDSDGRQRALAVLIRLGPQAKPALPELLRMLETGAAPVDVGDAFRAIGPDAAGPLMDRFNSNYTYSYGASYCLALMGADAAPELIKSLATLEVHRRAKTLDALGQFGPDTPGVLPALLAAARNEKEPQHRSAALSALRDRRSEASTVVPVLLAALCEGDRLCREDAARALPHYRLDPDAAMPTLKRAAQDESALVRFMTIELRWRCDHQTKAAVSDLTDAIHGRMWAALAALLDDLALTPYRPDRLNAAAAICRLDPHNAVAVRVLRAGLTDPDPLVRARALDSCAAAGPAAKELLPLLRQGMEEEDDLARINAATSLWKVGGTGDGPAGVLAEALRSSPFTGVRQKAAIRLGEMGADGKASAPALRDALKDRSPAVRFAAAEALPKVDPEAAAKAGIP